jgi:hypothetical protein
MRVWLINSVFNLQTLRESALGYLVHLQPAGVSYVMLAPRHGSSKNLTEKLLSPQQL